MSTKGQSSKKERIDKLLVDKMMASTLERAQAMILAGNILVNDQPVTKAGERVALDSEIRLKEPESKHVSRGALKLKKALHDFKVSTQGRMAIDVGASTGGFTEILLEGEVAGVHAIDVGTNQLAWKIRSNPRVKSMENYNARYLKVDDFNVHFDLLVMDVSFISIRLIIPAVLPVMKDGADLVVLFKPQFEVAREWVEEGGIVRNQDHARDILQETVEWGEGHSLKSMGTMESPIQGTDGNSEYLIHWKYGKKLV